MRAHGRIGTTFTDAQGCHHFPSAGFPKANELPAFAAHPLFSTSPSVLPEPRLDELDETTSCGCTSSAVSDVGRVHLGRASIEDFRAKSLIIDQSFLLDRGLSARTIRYTHAVLCSALKKAVRWKLLLSNPAELVDLPRCTRHRVGVLTVEQSKAFKNICWK